MLRVNEQDYMPIPTAQAIAADWPFPEGPRFMQLFFYFIKWTRRFVTDISQRECWKARWCIIQLTSNVAALAVVSPYMNLDFFDDGFFSDLEKCRTTLKQSLTIAEGKGITPPLIATALAYNMDYLLLQAHRIISWRMEPEQLARASIADSAQAYSTYSLGLLRLHTMSKNEVFQASRRVLDVVSSLTADSDSVEQSFLPG